MAGPRTPLFEGQPFRGVGISPTNYDVDRNGERFLMVMYAGALAPDDASGGVGSQINIVLNWYDFPA